MCERGIECISARYYARGGPRWIILGCARESRVATSTRERASASAFSRDLANRPCTEPTCQLCSHSCLFTFEFQVHIIFAWNIFNI